MKLAQEILLTNFVPAIITSCAFQNIIVSVCESLPSFIWMNVFSLLTNQQRIASIYAEVSCSKISVSTAWHNKQHFKVDVFRHVLLETIKKAEKRTKTSALRFETFLLWTSRIVVLADVFISFSSKNVGETLRKHFTKFVEMMISRDVKQYSIWWLWFLVIFNIGYDVIFQNEKIPFESLSTCDKI